MPEEKKYTIHADVTARVGLNTLGLPEQDPLQLRITLEGPITLEQYRMVFGHDADIRDHLCIETAGVDNYTIRIFLPDVLAEETERSHQHAVIRALIGEQGGEPLSCEEIYESARGSAEISLEAADALLDTAAGGLRPDEIDLKSTAAEMLNRELGLSDFLKEEGE